MHWTLIADSADSGGGWWSLIAERQRHAHIWDWYWTKLQTVWSLFQIDGWCFWELGKVAQSSPMNYCLISMLRAFVYHPLWETPGSVDILLFRTPSQVEATEASFLGWLQQQFQFFYHLQPNLVGVTKGYQHPTRSKKEKNTQKLKGCFWFPLS